MKPSRNERCPCGSGKKHKRCCSSAEAFNRRQAEKEAELERWRLERARRMTALQQHPSLCALSAVLAATIALKRP